MRLQLEWKGKSTRRWKSTWDSLQLQLVSHSPCASVSHSPCASVSHSPCASVSMWCNSSNMGSMAFTLGGEILGQAACLQCGRLWVFGEILGQAACLQCGRLYVFGRVLQSEYFATSHCLKLYVGPRGYG